MNDAQIAELAPAVVVRAACFPLRAVLELADAEFGARAAAVDPNNRQALATFAQAYEARVSAEQRILSAHTVESPRFARALCITNQELSQHILKRGGLGTKRDKRSRHLATTLYRYWARAVWRTAPCDLFSGVALAHWGETSQVTPTRARYAFAPDLLPYQSLVQQLSLTANYARKGVFKLNPTLIFDNTTQRWRYRQRTFSSRFIERELPSRPGLDLVLRSLAELAPTSLEDLVVELRRRTALGADNLLEALEFLRGTGALLGGLSFPTRFSNAWEALWQVAHSLTPEHALCWRRAIRALRRICRRLERQLDTLSLEGLLAELNAARQLTLDLTAALALTAPQLPRSILRCDTQLPCSLVFGPELKTALWNAAHEYDVLDSQCGLDAAVRAAHRRQLLGLTPKQSLEELDASQTRIPTQELAWQRAGRDRLLGQRLQIWSNWLSTPTTELQISPESSEETLDLPPLGGIILRPLARGFEIAGSTSEVAASYGRYGQLWRGLGLQNHAPFAAHALQRWHVETLARVAARAGVDVVEYEGPCEPSPSGLARPPLGFPIYDLWGTSSPLRLRGLHAELVGNAVLAFSADHPRPLALSCFTPLNLGFTDPPLGKLLLSSFREVPTWIFPSLPLACEIQTRTSPRLRLTSGNSLRNRKTLIFGQELQELVQAERPKRWVLWQQLAQKYGWPRCVLLSRDASVPVLVVTHSALALEAALEGLREGVTFLAIEEPDDFAWLALNEDTYVAEFIVPFLRQRHAWSDLATSQLAAS